MPCSIVQPSMRKYDTQGFIYNKSCIYLILLVWLDS
ncbi:hypothetical protein AAZX31_11G070300 [Glycine max]